MFPFPALSVLYRLEQSQSLLDATEIAGRRRNLSPMHGLRFFSEAVLRDEATVAAAYDEVRGAACIRGSVKRS